MIQVVHPGSWIQGSKRHRIPDTGVKKAPDPDPQHPAPIVAAHLVIAQAVENGSRRKDEGCPSVQSHHGLSNHIDDKEL
jgi:hypothetical protein